MRKEPKPPVLVALEELMHALLLVQQAVALTEPKWAGGAKASRLEEPARLAELVKFICDRWAPQGPSFETTAKHFSSSNRRPFPLSEVRTFTSWLRRMHEDAISQSPADVIFTDPMFLVAVHDDEDIRPLIDATGAMYLLKNPIRFQVIKTKTKFFTATDLHRITGPNILGLVRRCRDQGIKQVNTDARFEREGPVFVGAEIDNVISTLERANQH